MSQPAAQSARTTELRTIAGRLGLAGLVVLAVVPFAAPLGYLLVRNFENAEALGALADTSLLEPLSRSLALGTLVALGAAALGTGLAWIVARTDIPLRRTWTVLLVLPLVIPSFVGAFALTAGFAPGGLLSEAVGFGGVPVRGFWAAFAILTLLTYPYVLLPAAARLRSLPKELEESARQLGSGPVEVFRRVVLPQAAPAVWAGALLVFLYVVSDFGAVSLLNVPTLTQEIYANRLFDQSASLAMALLLALVAMSAFGIERSVSRRSRGEVRGRGDSLVVRLGRWRWPAIAVLGLVVAASLLAPLGVLAYWAVRGLTAQDQRAGAITADIGELVGPATSTIVASSLAALVAVVVILPIAYYVGRARGRGSGFASAIVGTGFALPGLVISLAFVFWALSAPGPIGALYQTLPLLILAYVVNFGALALGPAQVGVAGVSSRVDDAARTLGAGRIRRLLTIELPLITPALLAGAGLVLLSTAKELPATLLLAPPGFQTLATRIWGATEDAFWADASIASLVLVAISGVLTWLLVVRRADAVQNS
jgi:iron(III) transport system permease protein